MENLEISTIFEKETQETEQDNLEVCPVCEDTTVVVNGRCKTCYECFWSSCSL